MECILNDITVYYESIGEGRPIIMLHGWSGDHHSMLRTMEPVFQNREGWKRIYLDLPGRGKTPGKDWITNQDRLLDVVVDFIEKTLPEERFLVAGVSAGAYLARGVVYRKAAWMDGLLLIVPLVVAEDARRAVPVQTTLVADAEMAAMLRTDEAWLLRLAVAQSRGLLEAIRLGNPPGGEPDDEAFLAKIRENPENYRFSFDVDALPERFGAPTLILTGRQDGVVGYQDAWKLIENYPRATFAILDRAGHLLGIEQAGLVHALASEWLDRVEEYAQKEENA